MIKLESTASNLSQRLSNLLRLAHGARPSVRQAHKVATGKVHIGSNRRLTDAEDLQIATAFINGKTPTELANRFGVSRQTIYNALERRGIHVEEYGRKAGMVVALA